MRRRVDERGVVGAEEGATLRHHFVQLEQLLSLPRVQPFRARLRICDRSLDGASFEERRGAHAVRARRAASL
jgi:hypothetical protein